MGFYTRTLLGAVALLNGVSAWSTITETYTAETVTQDAETFTEGGFTDTITLGSTTFTSVEPRSTITQVNSTWTRPAHTATFVEVPEALESFSNDIDDAVIDGLGEFAQQISTLDGAVATKLGNDLISYRSSYFATRPMPAIETQIYADIDAAIGEGPDDPGNALVESIYNDLDPFASSTKIEELFNLITPYPSLSSEIEEYLKAAKTYDPDYLRGEGSIVSKDLSLTVPPPSWVSEWAASTGGAAQPTAAAAVMMQAGAAAAGLAALALL